MQLEVKQVQYAQNKPKKSTLEIIYLAKDKHTEGMPLVSENPQEKIRNGVKLSQNEKLRFEGKTKNREKSKRAKKIDKGNKSLLN